MSRVVEVDFTIGETVFFRLDSSPEPGLVTSITLSPFGACYRVIWPGRQETSHYAFELSRTPCYARKTD